MKRFLISMLFIACSVIGYAVDDVIDKKREYIQSRLAVSMQLCEQCIADIVATNELLVAKLKEFNETMMHMNVQSVVTNSIPYLTSDGKVVKIEKVRKLSTFAKRLSKLKMILANTNICEIINNYTTMHASELQTELDNALEEAKNAYEKSLSDIAKAEIEYKSKITAIVIKRKHEHAEKKKELKQKIKRLEDEIRICRHGGRLGTCYKCDTRNLEIKQIESEINSLWNIFANNIHNDAQLRALDEKTVKSDANLAKSTYYAYRNSLCNDMYAKIVDGTRSQLMSKIDNNTTFAKRRINELNQLKLLNDHPDFIRYSDVSSIVDAEIRAALDSQFTQRSLEKINAQAHEDEKFNKELQLIRARNAVNVKKTVYINVNHN